MEKEPHTPLIENTPQTDEPASWGSLYLVLRDVAVTRLKAVQADLDDQDSYVFDRNMRSIASIARTAHLATLLKSYDEKDGASDDGKLNADKISDEQIRALKRDVERRIATINAEDGE